MSRRLLWYDIIFHKRHIITRKQKPESEHSGVNPVLLRPLQYPIPDAIRCFYWAMILGVYDRYENGYFSIVRNKQNSIPESNLRVIEADLKRMDISREEYDKMYSVLVDSCVFRNE